MLHRACDIEHVNRACTPKEHATSTIDRACANRSGQHSIQPGLIGIEVALMTDETYSASVILIGLRMSPGVTFSM